MHVRKGRMPAKQINCPNCSRYFYNEHLYHIHLRSEYGMNLYL